MAVVLEGVGFAYGSRKVFEGFDFRAEEGEMTAVLGPSGCGKTTLLRLVAGLALPSAGRVAVDGGAAGERASFAFQEPRLFPWLDVVTNVALPLERSLGRKAARERAEACLELAGLGGESRALPDELSGGQRQRAALARAFAYPAPVVLLDEPFQSLDLPLRVQLMDATLAFLAREKRTAIAVTHDPREAIYLADRAVVLSDRPCRVVLDERIALAREQRAYSSQAAAALEARLFAALSPA